MTPASRARRAGGVSPIGEPVPRLPPMVARLRISREANWGNICASSGMRPSRKRSASESETLAPISTNSSVKSSVSSSGMRSTATTSGSRRPRMLTSTPQSVDPATSTAAGFSASRVTASSSVAGRTNRPSGRSRSVGTASGAGRSRRRATASSCSGEPSEYAASRIGRYPVHRQRFPLSACRSKPFGPCSWSCAGLAGGFRPAVAAVELRRHAAHEAGGAVSALRATAARHRILNRMQLHGRAEALGGDDLLPVERRDGDEAGVDGGPRRAAGRVGLCDQDRARAALTFGAPLFASPSARCLAANRGRSYVPRPTPAGGSAR